MRAGAGCSERRGPFLYRVMTVSLYLWCAKTKVSALRSVSAGDNSSFVIERRSCGQMMPRGCCRRMKRYVPSTPRCSSEVYVAELDDQELIDRLVASMF